MIALRPVEDPDLDVLFEHQSDPVAQEMAVFGARDRARFTELWTEIRSDPEKVGLAVTVDDVVAGNVLCWEHDGVRFIGYWIGREFWGRGVATEAVRLLLLKVTSRPLYAWVALSNRGSIRVLEKNGFRRVEPQPAPNQGDVPEQLMVLE